MDIETAGRSRDQQQEVSKDVGYAQKIDPRNYSAVQGAAGCLDSSDSMIRFWLEKKRDQHLIDADSIQALLDMLPAKIPHAAASALQRLLFK